MRGNIDKAVRRESSTRLQLCMRACVIVCVCASVCLCVLTHLIISSLSSACLSVANQTQIRSTANAVSDVMLGSITILISIYQLVYTCIRSYKFVKH